MPGTVGVMIDNLKGTATFTSWDEVPGYGGDAPVPRVARATVEFAFEGDIVGASTCQFAMYYASAGEGTGVGIELLRATVDGEEGTLALRSEIAFAGAVDVAWTVVPGSGTGAFAGFEGSGGYHAEPHATTWDWRLDREG